MINEMDVQTLKSKLETGEDLILLDVREQGEWDEAHIEQAKFMPLSNFDAQMSDLVDIDKKKTIVCQCKSGKRSLKAAMILQGEGFENLFNLEGGILAWAEAGLPTQS